jgi:hypothetical protein
LFIEGVIDVESIEELDELVQGFWKDQPWAEDEVEKRCIGIIIVTFAVYWKKMNGE